MRTKAIKLAILSVVLTGLGLLSSCGLDDINLTGYEIVSPEKNATYVGSSAKTPLINDGQPLLPNRFRVEYSEGSVPPSKQLNIVLNGNKVGHLFNHKANAAEADYSKLEQYLRQGENTFNVEPGSFGPSITFNYDGQGPTIVITEGYIDGNEAKITGLLRDASELNEILEVKLYNITGEEASGKLKMSSAQDRTLSVNPVTGEFSGSIDVSSVLNNPLIYKFVATDKYGFKTEKEYLADDEGAQALRLKNAVQVAVGETLVQALRPIIANSMYENLQVMPMDMRLGAWNDPHICWVGGDKNKEIKGVVKNKAYTQAEFDKQKELLIEGGTSNPNDAEVFAKVQSCVDQGDVVSCNCGGELDGATLPPNFDRLKGNMPGAGDIEIEVKRFYLDDGTEFSQQGTMLLNEFNLAADNELHLDLAITNMLVDITIHPINGIIVLAGKMNLVLGLEQTFVKAVAKVKAEDGRMDARLDKGKTSITFGKTPDVKKGSIWGGLPITGLLGALMPAIEGMITDMTPDIINSILSEELQKVVIGGVLAREDDPNSSFDLRFDVAQLRTQSAGPDYDLYVALDSTTKITGKDTNVKPMLGPVFREDPVNPSVVNNGVTGSNLSVALNNNLINQALNATYATGVTHLTLYAGKTYYGAHPLTPLDPDNAGKTLAKKGDTRVRLWPDVAPTIMFSRDEAKGNSQAKADYASATLYMDEAIEKNGVIEWKNTIRLKVNFDLAVRIGQKDNAFVLSADGPPIFRINEMENKSLIQVPQAALQRLLDLAMSFGGSLIADQMMVFDFGEIIDETLNGTEVVYLSSKDEAKTGEEAPECIVYRDGTAEAHPNANSVTLGGDGKYDLVCQTIEMRVSTETVTTEGQRRSNLFFQMTAEDKNAPPRMGIPNFDLDGDGVVDLRGDNCTMPKTDIINLYRDLSADEPALAEDVDENGNPSTALQDEMRSRANKLLAERFGGSPNAVPNDDDYKHYNFLRFWGDDPIVISSNAGAYPWLRMMYNNPSQSNIDGLSTSNLGGDRIGDLCEDDDDRDGIWASYDGIHGTQIAMPTPNSPNAAYYPDYAFRASGYIAAAPDNCPAMHNPGQEDTKQPQGVGDACNVRVNYVLLRSYESQHDMAQGGGEPMCLTHEGLINTNLFSSTMHTMKVCNSEDVNQRWYMRAVNNLNLDDGVEFYTNETRNPATASRLIAFGQQIEEDCSLAGKTSWTRVQEMRLVNKDNTALRNENAKNYNRGGGSCNERKDRGDPIWYPELVFSQGEEGSYEELQYPWVIRTGFNFSFGDPHRNEGVNACITYAQGGWGVDIDSTGEAHSCVTHGVGMKHRWSIWAGGEGAAWNGVW